MKQKSSGKMLSYIDLPIVYAILLLIAAFSSELVQLGNTVGIKMVLTVMVYILFVGIPLIGMRLKKIPFKTLGFSKQNIGKQLLIAAAIFIVTISVSVVIPILIGIDKTEVLNFKSSSVPVLIFYIIYDIICVGFGEEIAFRGYFYNRIKDLGSVQWLPMFVSALLFGFLHFPGTLNILNVIATFALGLGYGFCRWKIKNCTLLSLALAHGLHDAFILIVSFFLL